MASWPESLRSTVGICLNCGFPIAIYWGAELALLYNDAWSPIPAAKHPWALGRPGREVWPEIWADIEPLFAEVFATGEAVRRQDQLLLMRRRGFTEECYFDFTFSPVRNEQGAVGGIFNAAIETTPRLLSERRLRLLRDLAAETAGLGSVEEACLAAARSLGNNHHDLPFVLIYLLAPDGQTARLAAVAGLTAGAEAAPLEIPLSGPTPSVPWPYDAARPVSVEDLASLFPEPLPGGPWPEPARQAVILPLARAGRPAPAGFLVAGLSPRLAFDEEYRNTFGLIADAVATALDRAQAQTEAQRRAEELAALDRAKTAFFSNVSHEFRTPLTLLRGPIEDLLAKPENGLLPENRQALTLVHRNVLRLQKLVNTLLDFSRLEAGRMEVVFAPVDLAALTAELASNFRSAMEQAGLRFTVDCPPLSELMWVDAEAWEKIVLNLLSNAFKFTLSGGIAIRLRELGGRAELRVEDSGVGIPAPELSRVFERFHRIEGQGGRTMEGTGIGLALVQELVRMQGGEIRVESEEGAGSVFIVSLPLGNAHVAADRMGAPSVVGSELRAGHFVGEAERWTVAEADLALAGEEAEGRSAGGPAVLGPVRAHLLLADDNADMRAYASRLLSKAGYQVKAVADGEAALAALRVHRPDLIVTDVMMPRLDGFGLLAAIRADPATRTLPVVLLSARAGEEARIEGLTAGADDYLIKPFSARDFLATLAARLEISRARRDTEVRHAFFARLYKGIRPLHDPHEIVRTTSFIAGEHFGADRCFYSETNEAGTQVTVFADWRRDDLPTIAGRHDLASYGSVVAEAIRSGKNLAITDTAATGALSQETDRESWRRIQTRGVMIIPLVKGGSLAANFFLLTREPRYWTPAEIALAEEIAEQTWSALSAARAAEALRATEERNRRVSAEQQAIYETALTTMADFAYIFDLEGRFVYANGPLLKLWGLTREEAFGKDFHELHYPTELATKLQRQIQEVIETRQPLRDETPYTNAAGRTARYEYIFTPTFSAAGDVTAVVGVTRDVTALKDAEQRMRASRDQFRQIADDAPAMLWLTEPKGECTFLSRSWFEFTGQSEAQAHGEGWTDVVHPDDRELATRSFLEANARGGMFNCDYRLRRADGEYRWAANCGRPRFGEAGEFLGFIGSVIDIHERKVAEAASRQASEFLHATIDALSSHIAVLDEHSVILEVNAAWKRFADENGLNTGNYAIGTPYLSVLDTHVSGECEENAAARGIRAVICGQSDRFQMEYPCHSAHEQRWYQMSVTRFNDQGPVRVVVAHENITARVRAHLALSDADRRKDEFLAMLAHELRNPLASVANAVRLLQDGVDAADSHWATEVIFRQSTQLARLVDDLLDVSRISRGKIELRLARLDAARALETAAETVAPQLAERFHTLIPDYRHGQLWVEADPTRLEQIVANLLTNAARYTEPHGRIWLGAHRSEGQVVITVRDTGIGIPPERIEGIFDLFTQGERSAARSEGGLGIGLTVVRGLCEMHNGSVTVESAGPGQGSTFTVRLPAAEAPAAVSTASEVRAEKVLGGGGQSILIVDDNVDTAAALGRLLARRGYKIALCHDGVSALETAREFSPRAVLLDIGLPHMDGYEVARQLRAAPNGAGTLIVAVSGYGQNEDRTRSREAGFDHHFVKPIDFHELHALLIEALPTP